jgi:tetratricopeptide (TPR) repeat protein
MTTGQPSLDLPLPEFPWSGEVHLELASTAIEIGGELHAQLTWNTGSEPANCLLCLKDTHGSLILSQPVSPGVSEVRWRLPPDVNGTYVIELRLEPWVLAEERVEVLRSEELSRFNYFVRAISFREQAAKAANPEQSVRFDKLAADAYEHANAEDLAISSLFDVAATFMHLSQFSDARETVLRAMALGRKLNDAEALVRALYYLGEVDVKLDRGNSAIAALDTASRMAVTCDMDLIAVKSSALLCQYVLQRDHAMGLRYYREMLPKLVFAFSPAAQAEALTCIMGLKEVRAFESITALHLSGAGSWLAHCDFRSRYLSQHASISMISDVVVPWDASAESLGNALIKRLVTSFSKFLIDGFNLDVVLAVEAGRSINGESFKVGLRDIYVAGAVTHATEAWFRTDDFVFLAKLATSAGGFIRTEPRPCPAIVELDFPDNI